MATIRDIVTQALKDAGVLDSGESASDDDAATALEVLNRMMFSWKARSVDVNHATVVLSDTFALDDMHQDGVVAMLSVRLADMFDEPITPLMRELSESGWEAIQSDYKLIEPAGFDKALTDTPAQRGF